MKAKLTRDILFATGISVLAPPLLAADNCPMARTLHLDLPRDRKQVRTEIELNEAQLRNVWSPLSDAFEFVPLDSESGPVDPQTLNAPAISKLDLCVRASREPGLVWLGIAVTGHNIAEHAGADGGYGWITAGVGGHQMRRKNRNLFEYREVIPIQMANPVQRQLRIIPSEFLSSTNWAELNIVEYYRSLELFLDRTLRPLQVVAVLERLADKCSMSAQVSGDVSGHYFGDSAFFNARKTAVQQGAMAGTLADESMHEELQGLVGMMGAFAEIAEQQGVETGLTGEVKADLGLNEEGKVDDAYKGEDALQTPAQKKTEMALNEFLMPPEGEAGDNFGLSLSDIDLGHDQSTDVQPGAQMLSAFTLTLSGAIVEGFNWEDDELQSAGFQVSVSDLTMTAGAAAGTGAIKFKPPEEDGGFSLSVIPLDNNMIAGTLSADLETEGPYILPGVSDEPRKLSASVTAHFFAGRGFKSCIGR